MVLNNQGHVYSNRYKWLVENYALIKNYALIPYIYERFVKQIHALILISSQQQKKTNLTVDLHFLS